MGIYQGQTSTANDLDGPRYWIRLVLGTSGFLSCVRFLSLSAPVALFWEKFSVDEMNLVMTSVSLCPNFFLQQHRTNLIFDFTFPWVVSSLSRLNRIFLGWKFDKFLLFIFGPDPKLEENAIWLRCWNRLDPCSPSIRPRKPSNFIFFKHQHYFLSVFSTSMVKSVS